MKVFPPRLAPNRCGKPFLGDVWCASPMGGLGGMCVRATASRPPGAPTSRSSDMGKEGYATT
eukprot:8619805-Heterocapsa_arctica.AAC.1